MRKNQTILRAVLRAELYGTAPSQEWFMCHALDTAVYKGVITAAERDRVQKALQKYIQGLWRGTCVMATALYKARLINHQSALEFAKNLGHAFYWNWDNRPGVQYAAK